MHALINFILLISLNVFVTAAFAQSSISAESEKVCSTSDLGFKHGLNNAIAMMNQRVKRQYRGDPNYQKFAGEILATVSAQVGVLEGEINDCFYHNVEIKSDLYKAVSSAAFYRDRAEIRGIDVVAKLIAEAIDQSKDSLTVNAHQRRLILDSLEMQFNSRRQERIRLQRLRPSLGIFSSKEMAMYQLRIDTIRDIQRMDQEELRFAAGAIRRGKNLEIALLYLPKYF